MNPISLNDIPHRPCSFGIKELYFSSLAGLAHIAYGTALAVYKLVIYTHSLITQGHFFPRYQTAIEAANDVQPWQHLGRGAILLIPLIGSIFLLFYEVIDAHDTDSFGFTYLELADNLKRAGDPRHQLIIDLYILSYIYRDYIDEHDSPALNILEFCINSTSRDYAPALTLFFIKRFNREISRFYTLELNAVIRAKFFENSVKLLEKLIETDAELRNNPTFQEAAALALQIHIDLVPILEGISINYRKDLTFAYARLLEAYLDPIESAETIRAAFLEAGNFYEEYIQTLPCPFSAYGNLGEKVATCFEKGGAPERAEAYRPQQRGGSSRKQRAPEERLVPLSAELNQQTDTLITLIAKGGNQRAAFVEFINQFPDDPETIDALEQYLNSDSVKSKIKNAKRHFQRNCHPDRLEPEPNYVESLKSQRICSFFLQAAQ